MLEPKEIEARLEQILLKVERPGRYVGGEINSVIKDWNENQAKVALVFPDIYDSVYPMSVENPIRPDQSTRGCAG